MGERNRDYERGRETDRDRERETEEQMLKRRGRGTMDTMKYLSSESRFSCFELKTRDTDNDLTSRMTTMIVVVEVVVVVWLKW